MNLSAVVNKVIRNMVSLSFAEKVASCHKLWRNHIWINAIYLVKYRFLVLPNWNQTALLHFLLIQFAVRILRSRLDKF